MSADATRLAIVERGDGVELNVKVVPGASRTKISGILGTALKVTVAAPPEGGKANAAVVKLLASLLGLQRRDVQIVGGRTRPLKRIRLAGLSAEEARRRLGAAC